jgi:hypothetical protein
MQNAPQVEQNEPPPPIVTADDPGQGVRLVARLLGSSTLIAINPDTGVVKGFYMDCSNTAPAGEWAKRWNTDGYNIYYGSNRTRPDLSGKASKVDIDGLRLVAADVDAKNGRTLDQALADCRALPIQPSCIVMTGGGFQPIWVLPEVLPATDENTRRIEMLGKRIAEVAGGDAIQDIGRILRLPFTTNYPNAKKRADGRVPCLSGLVTGRGVKKYHLAEIELGFGAGPQPATAEIIQLHGTRPAISSVRPSLLNAAAQANLPPDQPDWFARLPPDRMDECLAAVLAHPEMVKHADADRGTWLRIVMAIAHAEHLGATKAYELARQWSMTSPKFDPATFDRDWNSYDPRRPGGVTVGTLFAQAKQIGIDLSQWRDLAFTTVVEPQDTSASLGSDAITSWPAEGSPEKWLERMNAKFFYAHDWGGEPAIGYETADGVRVTSDLQLRQMLANRYVCVPRPDAGGKQAGIERFSVGKWWLAHPHRREYDKVTYDPETKRIRAGERAFNLWNGLALSPEKGRFPLMGRHLFEVVCARDPAAFRYFIHWMAHSVHHPGTAPGVVIVLRSDREGTGKSTVLEWLVRMFGEHALMLSTAEDLLGDFNSHLENKSLICLNEPAFPGDHQKAGKLKAMITESTWLINTKFRQAHRVPNIAHIAITTNASWAVPAGNQARRFLVLDVSEHRAGDRAYFDALWHEANRGGIEAMLHALLKVDLTKFDLRNVPRTDGLRQQQLLSASTMVRWAMDAVSTGTLVAGQHGGFGSKKAGPTTVAGSTLYAAYVGWCDMMRHRPAANVEFGRWLGRCGFVSTRSNGATQYAVPDANDFGTAVMRAAGIV